MNDYAWKASLTIDTIQICNIYIYMWPCPINCNWAAHYKNNSLRTQPKIQIIWGSEGHRSQVYRIWNHFRFLLGLAAWSLHRLVFWNVAMAFSGSSISVTFDIFGILAEATEINHISALPPMAHICSHSDFVFHFYVQSWQELSPHICDTI